jgi:ubiquinone/menaquinone biosynthesis C-methylase UbiE
LLVKLYISALRLVLRIFFRLLYHEFAWTYDWVAAAVSAGHWSDWVKQAQPFMVGQHVLELGFGPGHLQSDLREAGLDVFGLDASPQMCWLASTNIRRSLKAPSRNGYTHDAKFVCGLGSQLPFRSGSFNTVTATFPTEYIFERRTAAEIARVLTPGGRLVIVLTAWITGKTLRERASALLFSLTGQSEPVQVIWQTPFSEAGLEVKTIWIDLGHSRVCILTGDKPG